MNILSTAACMMLSAEIRRQIELAESMGFDVEVSTCDCGDGDEFFFDITYNGDHPYLNHHHTVHHEHSLTLEDLSGYVTNAAMCVMQQVMSPPAEPMFEPISAVPPHSFEQVKDFANLRYLASNRNPEVQEIIEEYGACLSEVNPDDYGLILARLSDVGPVVRHESNAPKFLG